MQAPPTQATGEAATALPSPTALYKEAMHPLDVVRGSLDNWSNAELGALGVGIRMAAEDCAAAKPQLYQGEELYALAVLCAFGQDWGGANEAALAYIAGREEEHRAQAYAISVSALVHQKAVDLAVETAQEMLRRLPYDAEVAYALRDLKNDLVQSSDPAALPLASMEHPLILTALKQGVALRAVHGNAIMSPGALFESAMQLAFLERYAGDEAAAAAVVSDTEAALPASTSLGMDDAERREAVRTRYHLLGMHLPPIKILRALQSPSAKTQVDLNFTYATVLVFFPDWCVACRKMMKPLTEFAALNRNSPIHAYGLVFADESVLQGKAAHDENFKQMAGTRTLVVPESTVQTLGATEYPLGIVLDNTRTIRFVGPFPPDAFSGDGYVTKLILSLAQPAHAQEKSQD